MGRLYKDEMSSSRKVAVIGAGMFGVVCFIGVPSINILELTGVIKV